MTWQKLGRKNNQCHSELAKNLFRPAVLVFILEIATIAKPFLRAIYYDYSRLPVPAGPQLALTELKSERNGGDVKMAAKKKAAAKGKKVAVKSKKKK